MRAAKADWQVISYGNTVHSFTNPEADGSLNPAILYNEEDRPGAVGCDARLLPGEVRSVEAQIAPGKVPLPCAGEGRVSGHGFSRPPEGIRIARYDRRPSPAGLVLRTRVLAPCGSHVRNQDPLGPDPRSSSRRARLDLGGDAVDGLAARLPAAARARPGSSCAAGMPVYLPAGLLLVVVRLRRLCAADLRRGRLHRRLRRLRRDRRRHRHVGLAGARGQERRRPMARRAGRRRARSALPACSDRTASCSAARRQQYLRHDGPEHVLCFAPTRVRQGRRPCHPDAADLAGLAPSSTTSRARTGS